MSKRFAALFVFALIVVNLIVYCPNSRLGYVLDDHYVVAQNTAVRKPSLETLATSGFFDAANRSLDSQLFYYRPVVTASLALDYRLWGNSPAAFRWMNAAIHAANSLLVAALFYLLFANISWAVTGSFLFSVLPIHEWSVRYITGRGDLLSSFFGLASLVLLVLFLRKENRLPLWTSLVCFCLALLSKESSLLHVALTGLVAWIASKDLQRSLRVSLFFLLAGGSYYVIRQINAPMGVMDSLRIHDVLNGLGLAVEYVGRFLIPWLVQSWSPAALWIGLFIYAGIAVLILGAVRSTDEQRRRPVFFGLAWMMICGAAFIATQRIIDRLGPVLSEHFLYLAAVGFVLLVVILIDRISRPVTRLLFVTGIFLYFILLSLISARYWTSEETLLRYVHRMEGRNEGVAYEQLIMRYDPDVAAVLQMIRKAPSRDTQSLWYRRLGDIYRSQGQYLQAKESLARAADLNPRNIEAINELAVCHLETGAVQQGVKLLEESILISPQQSDAFRLLGVLNYRHGRFDQAVPFLRRAWANDPDQSEAALHLMMAFYFLNDQKSYVQTVERVSDHFKNPKMVLSFAANEFYSHGYFRETLKVMDQSRDLFHSDPAMRLLAQSARARISNLPR